MKRQLTILLILYTALLVSCGGQDILKGDPNTITPEDRVNDVLPPDEIPDEPEVPTNNNVPTPDASPDLPEPDVDPITQIIPDYEVSALSFSNDFPTSDREAIMTLITRMRIIIASDEFEEMVLSRTFHTNNGQVTVSAEVILERVRTAKKAIRFSKRDMPGNYLAMATVGGNRIMYPKGRSINAEKCGSMNTFFHEFSHNLGYGHKSKVPYGVGPAVGRLYCDMKDEGVFDTI